MSLYIKGKDVAIFVRDMNQVPRFVELIKEVTKEQLQLDVELEFDREEMKLISKSTQNYIQFYTYSNTMNKPIPRADKNYLTDLRIEDLLSGSFNFDWRRQSITIELDNADDNINYVKMVMEDNPYINDDFKKEFKEIKK